MSSSDALNSKVLEQANARIIGLAAHLRKQALDELSSSQPPVWDRTYYDRVELPPPKDDSCLIGAPLTKTSKTCRKLRVICAGAGCVANLGDVFVELRKLIPLFFAAQLVFAWSENGGRTQILIRTRSWRCTRPGRCMAGLGGTTDTQAALVYVRGGLRFYSPRAGG